MSELLRGLFGGRDDDACTHEQCMDGALPDFDRHIWYVLEDSRPGDPYWSETDVAYVLLQRTVKEYVCLGCGEESSIQSAERVGGRDGIKMKAEMSDAEREEFARKVRTGAFYNSRSWT